MKTSILWTFIVKAGSQFDTGPSVASQASIWHSVWNRLDFYSSVASLALASIQPIKKNDIRKRIWLVKKCFPRRVNVKYVKWTIYETTFAIWMRRLCVLLEMSHVTFYKSLKYKLIGEDNLFVSNLQNVTLWYFKHSMRTQMISMLPCHKWQKYPMCMVCLRLSLGHISNVKIHRNKLQYTW